MPTYATLQDAVDALRLDNQALTDEVVVSDQTATTAQTAAEAARVAAELAESNAEGSQALALQYKQAAEAAEALALQHKTDAEDQVPLAAAEKTAAQAARDTTVLTALGPNNDKLSAIASVYGKPSLNLDFAKQSFWKQGTYPWNQTALDPAVDLTFTRASTATYFDAAGVLQTAAADEMRYDHDPVTGEPLGVLIEESRTNLLAWSEAFDNGAWTETGLTVTANAANAPDGTNTADKLVEGSTSSSSHILTSSIYDYLGGTSYTVSVYVKAAERSFIQLNWAGGKRLANINLATGTVNSTPSTIVTAAGVEDVGSGWYRCFASFTPTDALRTTIRFYLSDDPNFSADDTPIYTGDGTSGIYLWGAQLEEGFTASSYIPTTTAAVTRAADRLYHTVGQEINVSEGTYVAVYILQRLQGTSAAGSMLGFQRDLTSPSPSGSVFFNGNDYYSFKGGGYTYLPNLIGVDSKRAVSYKGTTYTVANEGGVNPQITVSDSIADEPFFMIGNLTTMAHIKRVVFYPRAMTEAELVELTS